MPRARVVSLLAIVSTLLILIASVGCGAAPDRALGNSVSPPASSQAHAKNLVTIDGSNIVAWTVGSDGRFSPAGPAIAINGQGGAHSLAAAAHGNRVFVVSDYEQAHTLETVPERLYSFAVNNETGALEQQQEYDWPVSAGPSAISAIAASPDGRFVFALQGFVNQLLTFKVADNGVLSQVAAVATEGVSPAGDHLLISADGRRVWQVNQNGKIYSFAIDAASGAATLTSGPLDTGAVLLADAALSADGKSIFAAQTSTVGPVSSPSMIHVIAVGSDGSLTIKKSTLVDAVTFAAMAADPTGKFLYLTSDYPYYRLMGFELEADGSATPNRNVNISFGIVGALSMDASGRFLYVGADLGTTFAVDGTTGALTEVATTPPLPDTIGWNGVVTLQ